MYLPGLPLSGLNFTLACIQLGVNSIDAGELKAAVMGGVKVIGGIAHSILTMKLDNSLLKNAKALVMESGEAAVQKQAKHCTQVSDGWVDCHSHISNTVYFAVNLGAS